MYDVKEIRKQFPMLSKQKYMQGKPLVFLDNCSTTFKPQCVIDAEMNYYQNITSNSHRGDYDLCFNVDLLIVEARKTIANFVNCEENEVVFTSGDTAGLNTFAFSYGINNLHEDDEIILSIEEHASNVLPWFKIAKLTKAKIKYIPLDENGRLLPENLLKVITHKTKIVSLAHTSNVLGYTCDIKQMAKIAHEYNALIVVDGAQSVPHIKTDFKDLDIDILTFSAHKMCGPTGIGALIGKYELLDKIEPLFAGGGSNLNFYTDNKIDFALPPYKFEPGTLNIAGILGFKAAVDFINSIGIENIHEHDVELINYANEKLKDVNNLIVYNKDSDSSLFTFNIKDIFSQDEATLMNFKGIAIRSGLHCAKLMPEFLKVPATCRMSVYLYTTKEEVDAFIDAIINGGDILDAYFN